MGHEAQLRMSTSDVLLVGLDGLGVEIAKNVVLAGIKSLTIHDQTPASFSDLSAQFYLSESSIGETRASASLQSLKQLNEYVSVEKTADSQVLDLAFISRFRCVVAIGQPLAEMVRLNKLCRECGACFVAGDSRGVCAFTFCDFGDDFVCYDTDGEPNKNAMISAVTQDNPAAVTCLEDHRHGLESGDVVKITAIEGMEELNDQEYEVNVTGPYTFEIPVDASSFSAYVRSGYVMQVKQPVKMTFRPLEDALVSPGEFLLADFAKMDRPAVLHQAFRGLYAYAAEHNNEMPTPGDPAAAEKVWEHAMRINQAAKTDGDGAEGVLFVENLEDSKDVITRFAMCAAGTLSPMCAAMGGILGQEVLKACSGKFSPIRQWFYFDALEVLPEEPLKMEDVAPRSSRYDGQIAVIGADLQAKLCQQRYFLVGAGAIGCEMLKNWAMMGLGAGENGAVHVTDMDRIERSNLSRQFLFRSTDIGQPKSCTAAAAAKRMNPELHVTAYESKVAPSTEEQFNTDFYEALDGVCTALDNIDARLYMDSRCLFFNLPMLESGTMGTKGNTQVVVPHLTEHYGATRDPPEKSVPVCTLKNFPHKIEHTIQWARDWFEGVYKQTPESVNAYLTDGEFLKKLEKQPNVRLESLTAVKDSLVDERPQSFDDCVAWARLQFDKLFRNAILQLLHNFPLDHVTSSGAPFWAGSKKPPRALDFDAADEAHFEFVASAAKLRAGVYGIAATSDKEAIAAMIGTVEVPDFSPAEGVKISADEKEAEEENKASADLTTVDSEAGRITAQLPAPDSLTGFRLTPIDFDKDVDEQMAVVMAVSNLRARNYKIPESDMHTSRQIAGKIIPAIATTTAMVTGLISMELLKLLQSKELEAYKNGFANLAIPVFAFSEPGPPEKNKVTIKGEEKVFTAWDFLKVDGRGMTLKALIDYVESEYGVEVQMLSYGQAIVHSFMSNAKKRRERMPMQVKDVIELVTKKKLPPLKYITLAAMCGDMDTGDEVDLPPLRFQLL
eukprot:scaffold8168_cov239-Pinguiococcus_pyrenoidosus.AAC.4